MSDERKSTGKLLHTTGPLTKKLLTVARFSSWKMKTMQTGGSHVETTSAV